MQEPPLTMQIMAEDRYYCVEDFMNKHISSKASIDFEIPETKKIIDRITTLSKDVRYLALIYTSSFLSF